MSLLNILSDNYIEIFGVVTGVIYVFLEIRQKIWLWPVGIITSAVYIWVFFTSKLYADMSLQAYYLIISCLGWYWWVRGTGHRAQGRRKKGGREEEEKRRMGDKEPSDEVPCNGKGEGEKEKGSLQVTKLQFKTGIVLAVVFVVLYGVIWAILSRSTDSPVPGWDSFITSLSIVATWMLARKIYEHWYLWIIVNFVSVALFITRGLYPTVILYVVYGIMSFAGLREWKKTIKVNLKAL